MIRTTSSCDVFFARQQLQHYAAEQAQESAAAAGCCARPCAPWSRGGRYRRTLAQACAAAGVGEVGAKADAGKSTAFTFAVLPLPCPRNYYNLESMYVVSGSAFVSQARQYTSDSGVLPRCVWQAAFASYESPAMKK